MIDDSAASVIQLSQRILVLPRPLLLAFDVDGTLAPIVANPDAARIPENEDQSLEELDHVDGITVALITGRDAGSLCTMTSFTGYRVVEHGRYLLHPGETTATSNPWPDSLHAFCRFAEEELTEARIERKASSIGIHVREVMRSHSSESGPRRADAILAIATEHAQHMGLVVRPGRCVVEVSDSFSDKGTALRSLMDQMAAASVFFVGDDVTDQPAIEEAQKRGGIGAWIRSREQTEMPDATLLENQQQVPILLAQLTRQLRGEPSDITEASELA